jgi:hypothetical protein
MVLGLHWIVTAVRDRRAGEKFRFPWVFAWMALIGPILFLALWPRHWFDTVKRIGWYLNFHLKHVHYRVYYFGENIQQPPLPISYPWVMTLLTVPATILLAFAAGVVLWRRREVREAQSEPRDRLPGVLLAINILFPIVLISNPSTPTPIFGGTKHWATAMPYLSLLAAGGIVACGAAIGALLRARVASDQAARALGIAAVTLAVCAPALYASIEAYYNELAGSYRGAADLRMMRQFWGFASHEALGWVDEHAPPNARVWTHNTTEWAFEMYQKDHLVRGDLRPTSSGASQIALYDQQKAFVWVLIPLWKSYGTRTPSYVVERDGVPYLSVYARK